jgi:hypothetical protein
MKGHILALGLVAGLLAANGPAQAQRTNKSSTDGEPCCNITMINVATQIVTARTQAGQTFQFNVPNAALLKTLRIGQAVSADFGSGKVRVNSATPCCAIIKPAEPVGKPAVKPAEPINTVKGQVKPADPINSIKEEMTPGEPCCGITAIDARTGIATARESATGRMFRFEVKDAALLKTLKVGQMIFADFGTSKVRISRAEPCCNIIGHGMKEN